MRELVIIGAGGFAKEIIWLAKDCGKVIKGLLVDDNSLHGKSVAGIDVLGPVSDWKKFENCEFVIAIGSPRIRKSVLSKMEETGNPVFAKLIHPSVKMSDLVQLGEGAMICAGTILTVDIELGTHCILNLNVTVGHECKFGDFVTVAPMAAISGNVVLEDTVEIGTGAIIRQGLHMNHGSMLGMGGVLTKNVPSNVIFAGNPAKKLKEIC